MSTTLRPMALFLFATCVAALKTAPVGADASPPEEKGSIVGLVRYANGTPAAGVAVSLTPRPKGAGGVTIGSGAEGPGAPRPVGRRTHVNQKGAFRFSSVSPGEYDIIARGRGGKPQPVFVAPGQVTEVVLTLRGNRTRRDEGSAAAQAGNSATTPGTTGNSGAAVGIVGRAGKNAARPLPKGPIGRQSEGNRSR